MGDEFIIKNEQHLYAAVLWTLIACSCFAIMWAFIRLASVSMHPFVLVFWRNMIGLLIILPMFLRGNFSWLRTSNPKVHLRRALSGMIAALTTFYAVANVPMATAISISYAAPLFATIAAVLFCGEEIRIRRISGLVIGFIGVLIVVRPGATSLSLGLLAAFVSAIATAFSIISIKKLTNTEDKKTIIFYSFALMLLPSLAFAWPYWVWPHGRDWLLLLAIAMLAVLGQVMIVKAYALADSSALMPYDFIRFLVVVVIGIVWFDEQFDLFTLLGGSVILASTLYLAHRERLAVHSQKPTLAPKYIN
jgi:drug/metabolite transporter (DMT)-like permease